MTDLLPLLVIAGPTASGKSRLAVEVAEELGGEIVSADAFAVYRGLDIGTDKPSVEIRQRVRHHLIDVADPRCRYSAGEFAAAANGAIADIVSRGLTPIVAGGTHFYIRALVLGLFPSPPHDPELRSRLESDWTNDRDSILTRLRAADPVAADRIGHNDRQRILRALEVFEITGVPMSDHWRHHDQRPRYRAVIAAPRRTRDDLYARINRRVDSMFSSGLEEEVSQILVSGVPPDVHALKAIGYRQIVEMRESHRDRGTAIERTRVSSRKLAKRQLTWLRSLREGPLHWVAPAESGGTEALIGAWHRDSRGSEEG